MSFFGGGGRSNAEDSDCQDGGFINSEEKLQNLKVWVS